MANGIRDLEPRRTRNRKMNEAITFAMKCYREHKAEQDAANTKKIINVNSHSLSTAA
ncbi:MAG: hypothetical protein PHF86_14230 [Candidatus Nanoarchaeia archaeon]|jgi:hypothetical protein|nr:hypothetical protein [Candidatus Nanoarchaeia archaeon]